MAALLTSSPVVSCVAAGSAEMFSRAVVPAADAVYVMVPQVVPPAPGVPLAVVQADVVTSVQEPSAKQQRPTHGLVGVQTVLGPWNTLGLMHEAEVTREQTPVVVLQHAPTQGLGEQEEGLPVVQVPVPQFT